MNDKKHPRHMKLVKGMIKHEGDKIKAYQEAYPNQSATTVKGVAHNVFKKYPSIEQDAYRIMQSAFIKEGATPQKIAKNINALIDNPEKFVMSPHGEVISLIDNELRLKALKHATDVHLSKSASQQANTINNVQVNITDGTPDKLDGILSKLNTISRKLGTNADEQDGEIVEVESEPLD